MSNWVDENGLVISEDKIDALLAAKEERQKELEQRITDLERQLEEKDAEIARLREGLRKLEWTIEEPIYTRTGVRDGYLCYVCLNEKEKGHRPDCWLAALLKEGK